MEVIKTIIQIILCVSAVFLIAVIMLQSGKGGVGSAFGGSDSVVKGKARGRDAVLSVITKYVAIGFMVLAVALAVLTRIFA